MGSLYLKVLAGVNFVLKPGHLKNLLCLGGGLALGLQLAHHFGNRAARRIALIVDAHWNPNKPSYSNARHFTGSNLAEEVASPALRAFVVRRAKEDYGVAQAQKRTDNRTEKYGSDTPISPTTMLCYYYHYSHNRYYHSNRGPYYFDCFWLQLALCWGGSTFIS